MFTPSMGVLKRPRLGSGHTHRRSCSKSHSAITATAFHPVNHGKKSSKILLLQLQQIALTATATPGTPRKGGQISKIRSNREIGPHETDVLGGELDLIRFTRRAAVIAIKHEGVKSRFKLFFEPEGRRSVACGNELPVAMIQQAPQTRCACSRDGKESGLGHLEVVGMPRAAAEVPL
jgi:hypothetical protein